MSWANRALPVFMSMSSEKLRKVLHPIQTDTTHVRFKTRRNPGFQNQDRSVNRTAVKLELDGPDGQVMTEIEAKLKEKADAF